MKKSKILIADNQANMRKILKAILESEGYNVSVAADGAEAIDLIKKETFQTVITDLKMPIKDGIEVLQWITKKYPQLPVILITAHGSVETAVEAMKQGAFDFITKPFEKNEILQSLQKAVKTNSLYEKEITFDPFISGRFQLIGNSPQMNEIYKIIEKVAPSPSTILILGKSGTGKELVAKAIHDNSLVRKNPFIKINCAAIPENLVESELFGYEKGAFTGAVTSKPGRFELANGGTLFLDEIAELSRDMQVKLLRCIQEQEFERVGGVKTIHVSVRLLAATNSELEKEVESGNFREDLYYRLNVIQIKLPLLSERLSDIPILIEHFIKKCNEKLGKDVENVEKEVEQILMTYEWPGNIRELENVMERAVLLSEGKTITIHELPEKILKSSFSSLAHDEPGKAMKLKDAVKKQTYLVERAMIIEVLKETGGNITRAAKKLGISRKGLQTKMKEYKLRDEFKQLKK